MGDNLYLIWSIEHEAWWRPASAGYTRQLLEAGVYNAVETRKILDRANLVATNEAAIPVACVEKTKP